MAQKCNFVHDFANNADGRLSKTYQASCDLSTITELLVQTVFKGKLERQVLVKDLGAEVMP